MATVNRNTLKGYFKAGAIPTQTQFEDLIDSTIVDGESGISKKAGEALKINVATPAGDWIQLHANFNAQNAQPVLSIQQAGTPNNPLPAVRFSSQSEANLLYLDGASGKISIGTSSTDSKLTVFDDNKNAICIQTPDNTKSNGLAFQNSGGAYSWNIFREDAKSNNAHLVVAGGINTNNIDALEERLRITKDGNVGIGTADPKGKLHIVKTGGRANLTDISLLVNGRMKCDTPNGGIWMDDAETRFVGNAGPAIGFFNAGWRFFVLPDGNVGIGTNNPSAPLTVKSQREGIAIKGDTKDKDSALSIEIEGKKGYSMGVDADDDYAFKIVVYPDFKTAKTNASNNWKEGIRIDKHANVRIRTLSNTSDLRLKKNIQDLGYGLAEIKKLRPVSFFWKDKNQSFKNLGLIAQEVAPVLREVVRGDVTKPTDFLSIAYSGLIPVLINAIKELDAKVEALHSEKYANQAL